MARLCSGAIALVWLVLCILPRHKGSSAVAGQDDSRFRVVIDSPKAGSVLEQDAALVYRVRVDGVEGDLSPGYMLFVRINGVDTALSEESIVEVVVNQPIGPGIHTVEAAVVDSAGNLLGPRISSHVLVRQRETLGVHKVECNGFLEASNAENQALANSSRTRLGFGGGKWSRMRACLSSFISLYGSGPGDAAEAKFLLAQLEEAEGHWLEAEELYRVSASTADLTTAGNIPDAAAHADAVAKLAVQEGKRAETGICRWETYSSCSSAGTDRSCAKRDFSQAAEAAPLKGLADAELYLSIVMVARHDNTQFCQVPRESCLDRLRASLSILLERLRRAGLGRDSEIILVEWNPCYLNSRQDEGACDPRPEGYISLEQAVRELVLAPHESPPIRIMLVSEAMHEKLYNPYDFDLMEFIGKNVAARRALGRFMIFTNPDDVWSEALVQQLARRTLRDDVMYGTFRGNVRNHVPVGPRASVASMERFVAGNSVSSENSPQSVAHIAGRWRRAACGADDRDEEPMRSTDGGYGFFHDSAAGDFLLLPRAVVHAIRGYPEIPTNIMIDGTAIHAGAAHGFGQLIFAGECVIFHQPHPRSYNTKGSMIAFTAYEVLASSLLEAGTNANIRRVDAVPREGQERVEEALEWHRWNAEDWGLAHEAVPQVIMHAICE